MTVSYWFGGWSDADLVDRAYPLRALREGAGSDHVPASGTDAVIVARIRAGDETAFSAFYQEHAAGLLGYAFRLCGARDVAQDLVADLFVYLWERRTEWYPRSGVRPYLYAAVRHRVMNYLRDERRADERAGRAVRDPSLGPGEDARVDDADGRDERLDAVWRAVDAFPPLRRQVMYLRWARGLTPEEIASVLGLNRNAVDKHLSRAMRAIREAVPHLIGDG